MLEAIILGIIQGITELFPISSSGHLLFIDILNDKLKLGLNLQFHSTEFDIVLHIATFLAITIYFRKKIYTLLRRPNKPQNRKILINLGLTSLPTLFLGGILFVFGDEPVRQNLTAVIMLIFVGVLLITAGSLPKYRFNSEQYRHMNMIAAFVVGLYEALSLLRGTSRSGITLIGGMQSGLHIEEALDYAFLASLPVFFVLTVAQLAKIILHGTSGTASAAQMGVGFLSAFVMSFICLGFFKKLIKKPQSLIGFGVYRIILGVLLIVLLS